MLEKLSTSYINQLQTILNKAEVTSSNLSFLFPYVDIKKKFKKKIINHFSLQNPLFW
jgi:hypothetical protein